MVQHFTKDTFEAALKNSAIVLVDYWATWCGPCRMMAPVIDEIAAEYDGRITVGKIDVDQEPDIAQRYGIMSIPTLILYKDGMPSATSVGVRPKAYLEELIQQNL